jgi:hypothetical protein
MVGVNNENRRTTMIDKKEYFVKMTISHGLSVIAESEEEAIPIAKQRVSQSLQRHRFDSSPKINIINVEKRERIK